MKTVSFDSSIEQAFSRIEKYISKGKHCDALHELNQLSDMTKEFTSKIEEMKGELIEKSDILM